MKHVKKITIDFVIYKEQLETTKEKSVVGPMLNKKQ